MQRLSLDARLDNAQRALIDLEAGSIRLGDTSLGMLTAKGSGDVRQQKAATGPGRAAAQA
nr:hypothetical protein [Pseudomonas sp. BIGb0427]